MVNSLTVNFECRGLQYSIAVPEVNDNIPYDLTELFKEVIEKTSANPDIVIEQLIDYFGYEPESKDI